LDWVELSNWWRTELESDPAYEQVVTPLLLEVLRPESGLTYLDLGCGEGRLMRTMSQLGASVIGVDLSESLLTGLELVVVARLPEVPLADSSVDGVFSALTLEHLADHVRFFTEAARVTRPAGVLALVVNHPTWTAPDATPISDLYGEVLWRPGEYFSDGSTEMPAGEGTVVFHHRSMASLLNAASGAGWSLEKLVEQPHHEFTDQAGIPRLLACRWRIAPRVPRP
jgi:SAM-dependent methyltransferase